MPVRLGVPPTVLSSIGTPVKSLRAAGAMALTMSSGMISVTPLGSSVTGSRPRNVQYANTLCELSSRTRIGRLVTASMASATINSSHMKNVLPSPSPPFTSMLRPGTCLSTAGTQFDVEELDLGLIVAAFPAAGSHLSLVIFELGHARQHGRAVPEFHGPRVLAVSPGSFGQ